MIGRRLVALFGVLLVSACASPPLPEPWASLSGATPSPSQPQSQRPLWPGRSLPPIGSSLLGCGERSLIGRFRMNVETGRTVWFEPIDKAPRLFQGDAEVVPTLAGLVARAVDAQARGADRVELRTDPADGHPVSVAISSSSPGPATRSARYDPSAHSERPAVRSAGLDLLGMRPPSGAQELGRF